MKQGLTMFYSYRLLREIGLCCARRQAEPLHVGQQKNARRRFSFRGEEAGEGEGGVGPHRLVMDGQTRGASTTGSALRSVLVSGFVFLREGDSNPRC